VSYSVRYQWGQKHARVVWLHEVANARPAKIATWAELKTIRKSQAARERSSVPS
jgi:hypothetical protein